MSRNAREDADAHLSERPHQADLVRLAARPAPPSPSHKERACPEPVEGAGGAALEHRLARVVRRRTRVNAHEVCLVWPLRHVGVGVLPRVTAHQDYAPGS